MTPAPRALSARPKMQATVAGSSAIPCPRLIWPCQPARRERLCRSLSGCFGPAAGGPCQHMGTCGWRAVQRPYKTKTLARFRTPASRNDVLRCSGAISRIRRFRCCRGRYPTHRRRRCHRCRSCSRPSANRCRRAQRRSGSGSRRFPRQRKIRTGMVPPSTGQLALQVPPQPSVVPHVLSDWQLGAQPPSDSMLDPASQ